ncbi:MAG: bifunctional oligoribonuclease/PAP phosphatase NrnA [Clostridiales bacterium]|nr:bifunctional oligoribonuclease/PAP phosphatase NrnA [Clostridiales bacterium]
MTNSEVSALLLKSDDFLILTHKRPDGDTIGSAAALCGALRILGKKAYVLQNSEITPRFQSLLNGLLPPSEFQPSFIISCDIASDDLICLDADPYRKRINLCIDHHRINTVKAENYLIEEDSAACGEIVYELILSLGVELNTQIAEAIYIAISTDTGCFKFSNTSARTHRIASACYETGIPAGDINRDIFESKTRARFEMERFVFDNLHFYQNGKIALCLVPRAIVEKANATEDDLENISALPRQIKGVCAGITISETINGNSKISVRTVKGLDAACICSQFGGGGHERAAGATLNGKPFENEKAVLEAALKCIQG